MEFKMYEDIQKGLGKISSPLIKQTVDYLIARIEDSEDDETSDIAKSALLMYLNATAPGVLKADLAIEQALTKSFEAVEETVDGEKALKAALAKAGIYYFGPLGDEALDKHNTKAGRIGDPRAPGDKKYPTHARPPHVEVGGVPAGAPLPSQKEHQPNPTGHREMIGYLRDLKRLNPGLDIPSRAELKGMSTSQLVAMTNHHLPGLLGSDYIRGVGFSRNTTTVERLSNLQDYVKGTKKGVAGLDSGTAQSKLKDFKSAVTNGQRVPDRRVTEPSQTPTKGFRGTSGRPLKRSEQKATEAREPKVVTNMMDVPQTDQARKDWEKLKPELKSRIQANLGDKGMVVDTLRNTLAEAVKNPDNLASRPAPTPEAAPDPEVPKDVPKKARKLPSGGARAITQGDVQNQIEELSDGFMPQALKPAVPSIRATAAAMVKSGTPKEDALKALGTIAVKLESMPDRIKEAKAVGSAFEEESTGDMYRLNEEIDAALANIREMGYTSLAAYFKDKLNIGETISAVFSGAPKNALKKNIPESVTKFHDRLEKLRKSRGLDNAS